MSVLSLREIEGSLDKVGEDLWIYDEPDLVIDGVKQRLSRLQAQAKVLTSLQTTANILRQQSSDKPLPNQQAIRVKHFIKFVFEKTTRGNERHMQLRKLDCNVLKFCGLAYKIKDVLELPTAQFAFLVENVADFVQRRHLSQYLYRDDIDKAVNSKLDPEDDDLFKEFLKTHIELRPAKRKRYESPPNTGPDTLSDTQETQHDGPPQSPQTQGGESGSLTGDVYELTIEDVRAVAASDQIEGRLWLTNPYYMKSSPFITVPISKKLGRQFANQRPQMM